MGIRDNIRERREAREEHETRRRLIPLATELHEPGDTVKTLRAKVVQAIDEDPTQHPFRDFLLKILDAILPALLKLLTGLAGVALLFTLLSLFASSAEACGRCGLFGRQCRFAVASHHVAHVPCTPAYAASASQTFNFINNGYPGLPLAAQGQSVYGYNLAAQAYAVDPSAVLSQAARLTSNAQALASDGFAGFNLTAQSQLSGQVEVAKIIAAGQANAAAITAAKSDAPTAISQFSFRATVENGTVKAERLDDASVQALSVPSDGSLAAVLTARCVECHSGATPKAGLDLSNGAAIDGAGLAKILARVTTSDPTKLMPRGKARLSAADLAPLFSRAEQLRASPR